MKIINYLKRSKIGILVIIILIASVCGFVANISSDNEELRLPEGFSAVVVAESLGQGRPVSRSHLSYPGRRPLSIIE
jgi:hypothetical protein